MHDKNNLIEMVAVVIMGIREKRSLKTKIDSILLIVYTLLSMLLVIGLIKTGNALGASDWQHSVMTYALLMISLAICHIWTYVAVKTYKGMDSILNYFNAKEYKIECARIRHWMNPLALRGGRNSP